MISEFRRKSHFRLASPAEGLTEKGVTFIAVVWGLRCFTRFKQGITHVSRTFRACFAMFRGVSRNSLMIRGFAMFHDVSHMFRARFARFAQGITHVSRMFRACFAGVKHGECASHTGRP